MASSQEHKGVGTPAEVDAGPKGGPGGEEDVTVTEVEVVEED